MRIRSLVVSSLLALSATLGAAQAADPAEQIRERLTAVNDRIEVVAVKASALPGIYEVELGSGEVLYSSESGNHFILGKLFEVRDSGFVNLTEQRQKAMRAEALAALEKEDMIIFSPEGEAVATLYAFTDVDCGYCRKLHNEMAEYNARGIEIRYLAFPRAGVDSGAYDKMVSVWCAEDPQQAMTLAKQGQVPPQAECENPVAEQYQMGVAFGVTGTPALVFEDGSLMPGYVPAERLAAFLASNQ
ncbi:thioredoxin fold domain-containing protein [Motiliproteus sp. SC1-56]|uniref:thioredoxin fold domain-containing protein n=1 Tax=Motiliproteus sp. SC1-56 TaxID=2799565 RepID=UPI001F5DC9CE|nr:thioredoxin fold domain-containing protein [Motiliproteus sp. SC1-56]